MKTMVINSNLFSFLKNGLVIILVGFASLTFSFSYDRAVYAAQKENWQKAYDQFNSIITDNPDKADVLHDAGVVAHKLGNKGQARACLTHSADCAAEDELRFLAHFKAGTLCVEDKDLECALEHYDKALTIKPEDEYARHNRDRVAQMIEDQKKEQEQQKDNDQNNDQNDDQEDKEDNKDQKNDDNDQQQDDKNQEHNQDNDQNELSDNNDQQSQQNNDQKNKQNNGQNKKNNHNKQQEDDAAQDQLDQQSKDNQYDKAENANKDTQRKEQGQKQQDKKNSSNNQERDNEHEFNKQPQTTQQKGDRQKGGQHRQAPEKQSDTQDTSVSSEGMQEQDANGDKQNMAKIDDPWLLNILNNQEKQDQEINKQLMEAKVRQHGGKNVQNAW